MAGAPKAASQYADILVCISPFLAVGETVI